MRRLHLPVERKVTAIVEEHVAIVYAIEWGMVAPAEVSVRHHPQDTLAAAENIRSGHFRLSLDG